MKNDFTVRLQAVAALEVLKGSRTIEEVAAESGVDVEQLEHWKAEVIGALKTFGAGDALFTKRLPRRARSNTASTPRGCYLEQLSSLNNAAYAVSTQDLQWAAGPPELS